MKSLSTIYILGYEVNKLEEVIRRVNNTPYHEPSNILKEYQRNMALSAQFNEVGTL